MLNKLYKKKWKIKPRIFLMLLLMLVIVFSCVFLAFNLFMRNYIRSNVETQLDDLVGGYGENENKLEDRPQDDNSLPDLSDQPKNKIGARGEVFIVDSDYNIKGYNTDGDIDEQLQIASYLQDKDVSFESAQYIFVRTEQSEYYISSVEDSEHPGSFFIFYVNVSGIYSLMNTVNFAMAVIVAAAMAICFIIANLIAGSVTSPVKKLRVFADEIGRGSFVRKEFSFRDIEFDELGEAMNQSAEKLDLYDKDQRTFFQNVSHELRTPLMSIRCYAEGVEHGLMDPQKAGATIISETDRLTDLVEDLLYISRVDSITNQFEKQENDLRETLSLCAESLKTMLDKGGLRIEYQFDEEPVLFAYNEKHMYRAFINLISNALRYARETIILRCLQTGEQIEISVIDDGKGIASDELPHIFERFYKGRDGRHGIGLSIVKSVVELHRGEITVNCDQGTCFKIVFRK